MAFILPYTKKMQKSLNASFKGKIGTSFNALTSCGNKIKACAFYTKIKTIRYTSTCTYNSSWAG